MTDGWVKTWNNEKTYNYQEQHKEKIEIPDTADRIYFDKRNGMLFQVHFQGIGRMKSETEEDEEPEPIDPLQPRFKQLARPKQKAKLKKKQRPKKWAIISHYFLYYKEGKAASVKVLRDALDRKVPWEYIRSCILITEKNYKRYLERDHFSDLHVKVKEQLGVVGSEELPDCYGEYDKNDGACRTCADKDLCEERTLEVIEIIKGLETGGLN
jgi:hypothetical protein